MSESSYRGFPISIFIRRRADEWEVTTTIYAPEDLVHELGDRNHGRNAIADQPNRAGPIGRLDQAKKIIDRIVRDRAAAIPLEN